MGVQTKGGPKDVRVRAWRISLRARGVAVLAVPMAALFAALFSIYWVEGDVHQADETVVRAYAMRGNLVDLRSSLLDAQTRFPATWPRARSVFSRSTMRPGSRLARRCRELPPR